MVYKLTIFQNIFDTSTHRKMEFEDWEGVESLLLGLSREDGYKPNKNDFGKFQPSKKSSPLISPAFYEEGRTRKNKNVLGWTWAALDIDDYDCSYSEAVAPFMNIRHTIYSSASSTKEHPKFRVVIPFTRIVHKEEIKHVWFALNTEFNSMVDPQTKDLSRMYYVPARYPDAYNFIEVYLDAPMIDIDDLLRKHPFQDAVDNSFRSQLSQKLQDQLLQYRMEQLTNKNITWSSYRDCPFVNKKIVAEYRAISESGWYHTMYRILCSIAVGAIHMGYPITASEIATLAREIDNETGGWYRNRPLEMEAQRALEYALKST